MRFLIGIILGTAAVACWPIVRKKVNPHLKNAERKVGNVYARFAQKIIEHAETLEDSAAARRYRKRSANLVMQKIDE